MAHDEHILDQLEKLAVAYPHQRIELTEPMVQLWQAHLRDLPEEVLAQAVAIHTNSRGFFPAIAELRRLAVELQAGVTLNFPEAYAAYETVQAEIQRVGFRGQPHFDNPLTTETVRRLSWRALCQSTNANEDRRRFIECYDRLLKRAMDVAVQPPEMQARLRALSGVGQVYLSAQGDTHD